MRELLSRIWKKDEGFSLIELIIVIAILAIIAAIAVPNLLGNIQKANVTTDQSNAKLIADAMSVAIANDPDLVGSSFAITEFTAAGATALSTASNPNGAKVITDAIAGLNGKVPELKSTHYISGTDKKFYVVLSNTGVITISNAASGKEIFPNPVQP